MNPKQDEQIRKWRMILGRGADPEGQVSLSGTEQSIDQAVEALYDSERQGGLGNSAPNVNRWLGDIRNYFPSPVVRIMQKDAMEQLGLDRMLLEPELLESLEPDIELVGTLLSLKNLIPEQTRSTAREIVQKLVRQLEQQLKHALLQAVKGALHKSVRKNNPRLHEMNWHRTIRANLKNYQPELGSIIPEQFIGYGNKSKSLKRLILLIDQSASMAESLVYAGIAGSIMASLPSIQTHFVVFDTQVVNLTDQLDDPVDLLFSTQLGGGTDIGRALAFAQQLVSHPAETVLVLISDLYEGGNPARAIRKAGELKRAGVTFISLLALDDQGAPSYDKEMAQQLYRHRIPCFACTPGQFPDLMAAALNQEDIEGWMSKEGIIRR
jgi:Mg-chelatase subunit ChlD